MSSVRFPEREDRINRNAPEPADATIAPPTTLSDAAQQVWARLAPDLISRRVLTHWDADLFACYCDAVATYYECRRRLGEDFTVKGSKSVIVNPLWRVLRDASETMTRLAGRFGLTPSDRSGLDLSTTEPRTFSRSDPERILG